MKKVAIVINTSWNIFNFRIGLMNALRRAGYRVIAVAPADEYSKKIEVLGFEYHDITIHNKGTNPVEDLRLIWDFHQLYRRIKPDVLLHFTIKPNIYGTIAARLSGIAVISNISGLGTVFLNDKLSSRVARLLYKFALRFSSKVFFQNGDDRMLFVDLKIVDELKTGLLPGSGIDTEYFSPGNNCLDNASFTFLFIARLVKDKGLIEYVDAARKLKSRYSNVRFKILGSFYPGNPTAITRKEMARWEQEEIINYLGTSDDVKSVIANADCVVLPSYREGLSRVLLEAASMAKPIVTTNVPGCKDVVENGLNGFLCKPKNTKDLADKMDMMIQLDPVQRTEMGLKGRQKVIEEFGEEIVIEKYQNAITEILDNL